MRVVVVNYEGGELTLDCLRSVLATDWPPDRLEVVLVDNASHDGVADRVERELPGVTVVRNDENRGFAGGVNAGLHDLGDTDHVALLNNDATVEPGWLAPLVAALEENPALGAVCPKVLLTGTGRIDNVGVELGEWGRGADRGHGEPDDGRYDAPTEVFAWCGAAVLLRRAYLDAIGHLDERLFLYCEDLELAWRGRAFGWRYRTVPESVVHHRHGATTDAGSKLQRGYNLRNALLVSLRHAPLSTTAAAAARSVAAIPVAAVRHPGDVPVRARAFAGFVRLAPAMLRSRADDRRAARAYSRAAVADETPGPDPTASDGTAYTGVDNLEVMASAVHFARWLRDTVAAAAGPVAAGPKLLDFGAGTGTVAERVRELGYDVACLEPDASLRAHLGRLGLQAVADPAGAAAHAPFDVVYSISVIEHIEDDVAALRQLRDLQRDGGRLVLFVPAFPLLYSAMDRKIGHFRRYRRDALVAVVEQAGYVVDRARYVDCIGFFGSLANKVAGNKDGDISEGMVAWYDRWLFRPSLAADPLVAHSFGRNLLVTAHR